MSRAPTHAAKHGFTLIEVLAAFAVASVIMMSTAMLVQNVTLSFDRGANRVSAGDRLTLAADRLATDIGSARFVLQGASPGAPVAFLGGPTKITFIGAGIVHPASPRENAIPAPEVISVAVEAGDQTTALVRRRGVWRDPRARLTDVALGDDVVLVAGRFDAAFSFARMSAAGGLSWSSTWSGEQALPRLVKLNLRDRASGIDLMGGGEILIRADAAQACAREGATVDCLANPAGTGGAAAAGNSQASTDGPVGRGR